jgi:hypothetical protein
MIDFYPIIAVLLACLLAAFRKAVLSIFAVPLACILIFGIVQTYQYYHHILQHHSMTQEKYWYVFMMTNSRYENSLGGNTDLAPYSKKPPLEISSSLYDFEQPSESWLVNFLAEDPANPGTKSCLFDQNPVGLYYSLPIESSIKPGSTLFVEVSLKRLEFSSHSSSAALLEASVERERTRLFNYEFRLNDFPDDEPLQWRTYHYSFSIKIPEESFETVIIQVRNPMKQKFLIDDVEIRAYRVFPE